jgi:hypothetical protein
VQLFYKGRVIKTAYAMVDPSGSHDPHKYIEEHYIEIIMQNLKTLARILHYKVNRIRVVKNSRIKNYPFERKRTWENKFT